MAMAAADGSREGDPAIGVDPRREPCGTKAKRRLPAALATQLLKLAGWTFALHLLNRLEHSVVVPDLVAWSAAQNRLAKQLAWRQAVALLGEVQQRRLQVDAVLTAVTINACRDRWQQACAILANATRRNLSSQCKSPILKSGSTCLPRSCGWKPNLPQQPPCSAFAMLAMLMAWALLLPAVLGEVCDTEDFDVAVKREDPSHQPERLELLQRSAGRSDWVAGHHGPGHTTVVHHNPPGIRGGFGHGTTVVHHSSGYHPVYHPVYHPPVFLRWLRLPRTKEAQEMVCSKIYMNIFHFIPARKTYQKTREFIGELDLEYESEENALTDDGESQESADEDGETQESLSTSRQPVACLVVG
eukprot:g16834.t1